MAAKRSTSKPASSSRNRNPRKARASTKNAPRTKAVLAPVPVVTEVDQWAATVASAGVQVSRLANDALEQLAHLVTDNEMSRSERATRTANAFRRIAYVEWVGRSITMSANGEEP